MVTAGLNCLLMFTSNTNSLPDSDAGSGSDVEGARKKKQRRQQRVGSDDEDEGEKAPGSNFPPSRRLGIKTEMAIECERRELGHLPWPRWRGPRLIRMHGLSGFKFSLDI